MFLAAKFELIGGHRRLTLGSLSAALTAATMWVAVLSYPVSPAGAQQQPPKPTYAAVAVTAPKGSSGAAIFAVNDAGAGVGSDCDTSRSRIGNACARDVLIWDRGVASNVIPPKELTDVSPAGINESGIVAVQATINGPPNPDADAYLRPYRLTLRSGAPRWEQLLGPHGGRAPGSVDSVDGAGDIVGTIRSAHHSRPVIWTIGAIDATPIPMAAGATDGGFSVDVQGDLVGGEWGPNVNQNLVIPFGLPPVVLHCGLGPIRGLTGIARSAGNPDVLFVAGTVRDRSISPSDDDSRAALWRITLAKAGSSPVIDFRGILPALSGDSNSFSSAINSRGLESGAGELRTSPAGQIRPELYTPEGTVDLYALVPPAGRNSALNVGPINSYGQIAGWTYLYYPTVTPAQQATVDTVEANIARQVAEGRASLPTAPEARSSQLARQPWFAGPGPGWVRR